MRVSIPCVLEHRIPPPTGGYWVGKRSVLEEFMREVTYTDAIAIGELLNVHRDEVWKIVRGRRFTTQNELCLAVHDAFKGQNGKGSRAKSPSRDAG